MESNSCKGLVSALTYPLHVSRPENGRWQHSAPGHSLECVLADERPLLPTSKRAGLEPALSSLRRAALRHPFARVLSVHPAASMLAPATFPGWSGFSVSGNQPSCCALATSTRPSLSPSHCRLVLRQHRSGLAIHSSRFPASCSAMRAIHR